jgi:hypothetical protein
MEIVLEIGKLHNPCGLYLCRTVTSFQYETLGQFFLRALQSGSPYKDWPAAARTALGAGSRSTKVTFYYD